MKSILFSYQDSLLLSGVVVILLFTVIQAYIYPFKNRINNILDLLFMGIFITLAIVILYLYPNTGHEEYIAVNILGGTIFLLFLFIMIFHLHNVWYSKFTEALNIKFNMKNDKWNPLHPIGVSDVHHKPDRDNFENSNCAYLRETLLEKQFN